MIFSAFVEGDKKLLSICGSKQLDDHRGYLQYRFGRPGMVEMEFPTDRRDSQSAFRYTRYTRPRVTYLTLTFEANGYRYSLHEDHDAERGPAKVKAYLTRLRSKQPGTDPAETTMELRVPKGSLMKLESVVPNVP